MNITVDCKTFAAISYTLQVLVVGGQSSAAEVKDEEADPHLFHYIEYKMRLGRAKTKWKCSKARVKCPHATLHSRRSKESTFSVAVNETLILHPITTIVRYKLQIKWQEKKGIIIKSCKFIASFTVYSV